MSTPDDFRHSLLRGLYDAALRGSGTDLEVLIPRRGNDAETSTAQFHLHYPIVAASSAYFAANPEPKSGRVIGDVDHEAFAACVKFMYTGELPSTEPKTSPNMASILDAAKILQIDALKERCSACMGSHHLDNFQERTDHPSSQHELAVEPAGHIDCPGVDALRHSLAHMAAQLKADLLANEDGDGRAALTRFCDNLMNLNLGMDEMEVMPGDGGGAENDIVGGSAVSATNPVEEVRPSRQMKDAAHSATDIRTIDHQVRIDAREVSSKDTKHVFLASSLRGAGGQDENTAFDASSDTTSVESIPWKQNTHDKSDASSCRVVAPPHPVEEVTQQEEKKEGGALPYDISGAFVTREGTEEREALRWRRLGSHDVVPRASATNFATGSIEPEKAGDPTASASCIETASTGTAVCDLPKPMPESAKGVDDVAVPKQEKSHVTAPKEENDKERVARLLREEREKAAAAKAKKKSKRSKKHDKWLQEQEAEKSKRKDDWQGKIDKEREGVYLISQLVSSEFLRQNKENEEVSTLTMAQLLEDSPAADAIEAESKKAHTALFGGLSCRVKVAGLDRKNLNGRQGTLRSWDADQGKFLVGLDTKKAADSDVHLFLPENLEATSAPRPGKGNSNSIEGYRVDISVCFSEGDSVGCQFTADKSMVASLRFARSIDEDLEALRIRLDEEDRKRCTQESREWKEYEEDRIDRERRKKQKANAKAEARRRKEERRVKWQKMRDVALKAKFEAQNKARVDAQRKEFDRRKSKLDRELERTSMQVNFMRNLEQAADAGIDLHDFLEQFVASFEDKGYECDAEDFDFFDEILDRFAEQEREYKQRLAEEMQEKDGEMAELLGVASDADERTLKVAYMQLARQYHPDKWRADSEHGMARDEAHDRFYQIQNAYDHLRSRFEDDRDSDDESHDDEVVLEREKQDKIHIDFIASLQGECWRAEEVNASEGDDEIVKGGQRMARVDFVATVQGDCWKAEETPENI